MKNNAFGIGIIGTGLIGTMHAVSLQKAVKAIGKPVRLVAAADKDAKRAERFASAFGFERASTDYREIADNPEIQAAYVCTWTSEHKEAVMALVEKGKSVFCEKPLAFTAGEARAMYKAAVESGVTHQVGLVLRRAPVWSALREKILAGGRGFPIAVIFRDDQCFPIKGSHPGEWRKDPAKAGAGCLIEHSIHDLDLLEWIFGPILEVRAETVERFGHAGIEDLAKVDLYFESGMRGSLISIWHDVLNRHSNRRMEVFYEKEYLAVESEFTGPIALMAGEGPARVLKEDEVNRIFWGSQNISDERERELTLHFGALEDYQFLKSAMEGNPADPDFSVAVRAHELVDACYRSAPGGRKIKVKAR